MIQKDPSDKLTKQIKQFQIKYKDLDFPKLHIMNPNTPKLYCLPKIHKQGNKIRPVVSQINSATHKLSNWWVKNFIKATSFKSKHSKKNTDQLFNNIQGIRFPNKAILFSLDVTNLFPSIPLNEVNSLIETMINECNGSNLLKEALREALHIFTKQNFFQFNNQIYVQKEGVSMGSNWSPLFAEIFMAHFEEKIFKSNLPIIKNIIHWSRYVDDIFIIWSGTLNEIQSLLTYINNLHNNLKFTLEIGEKRLNFLDITINLNPNGFTSFEVYRKPTNTSHCISYHSNQHISHINAFFNNMFHRLFNYPLNKKSFINELSTIIYIGLNNQFPIDFIKNLFIKNFVRYNQKNFSSLQNTDDKSYVSVEYINKYCNSLVKVLKRHNINLIFKNNNNIKSLLVKNKDLNPPTNNSGVYKLTCNCGKCYIGQTGRSISTRVKEHLRDLKSITPSSSFAQHLIYENHDYNKDNFLNILHFHNKGIILDNLENYEILSHISNRGIDNILNDQTNPINNKEFLNNIVKYITDTKSC